MKRNFYTITILICMAILTEITSVHAQVCEPNYLSVSGNKLIDKNGNEVQLTGVNWFGFETSMATFHGIWSRDLKSMLRQIKDQGFNCIRIPWHNQMLTKNISGQINAYGTDPYTGVSPMNEEVATKTTSIEILDIAIQWCQDNNLKVILDNHSREPDGYMVEELWYTEEVSHEQWMSDWVMMADRYKNYDAVIAMDINNEPHGKTGEGSDWGSGNPATDWRLAAQQCGNAILDVNPNVLIMVEGTEWFQETSYWWGGNLQGAQNYPVELNIPQKLVYSPHEYGPTVHEQEWFTDPDFPDNMEDIWESNFNYLYTNKTSPLFFGEFGIRETGGKDEIWFDKFLEFMGEKRHHWTFWCWNPNSGDTGGLLDDQWTSVIEWKMEKLRPYLAAEIPNCTIGEYIAVTGITMAADTLHLSINAETTLKADVLPADATNKNVFWSSTDSTVASIGSDGHLTALKTGSSVITAKTEDGLYSTSCVVLVSNNPMEYTLSTSVIGNGSIATSPTGNIYASGTEVSLIATPDSGFVFAAWSGDLTDIDNPATILMDSNKDINAIFTEIMNGCLAPTKISLPYKFDGEGELCWETTVEIDYINSWGLDILEINGEDFTNIYSNTLPDKINDTYNIRYKSSVGWSHFEANGNNLKGAKMTPDKKQKLLVYPNPLTSDLLTIEGDDEIIDSKMTIYGVGGHMIYSEKVKYTKTVLSKSLFTSGVYLVEIVNSSSKKTIKLIVK